MAESFTKLLGSILNSTVWAEDDHTRIVWITMLAMADANGYVGASVPGLAYQARVPIESARRALERFTAPDPESRSQEHEGRRITKVERGWLLLNYRKIREVQDLEEHRLRDRERKRRDRAGAVRVCPRASAPSNQAEAEAEEEEERESNACAREVETAPSTPDLGPRATRPWPEVDGEPAGSSSVARALLVEAQQLSPPGADELRPGNRRHFEAVERLLADGEPAREIKAILHWAAAEIRAERELPRWWGPRMFGEGPWTVWRSKYAESMLTDTERERRIAERQQELRRAEEQQT